ncbi:hypothetical protein [Pseudovibrio sp. POLY-S9]|uniref:hypothetical protein n=1 Tax=Pseudovibrio sp. POLY-S9 TaxID=1576596 RepID=UPI00070ECE67|nr:hypothetical protein [Pseudovibrio sp. POLY-S9]
MDNELILAVAGAGKTTRILNSIKDNERCLIITYTNENLRSLEASLKKKYDGIIPENIMLSSYFSFLYSFCFRPILSYKFRDNAFNWNRPPAPHEGGKPKSKLGHYMSSGRYIYANRMTKMIERCGRLPLVIDRLEKYFDCFYVDEVQDFAANDFNFLLELSRAKIPTLYVGDFFQHTFDTSRDGRTRENLHKKGLDYYIKQFQHFGFRIDTKTLGKTYRCSPTVSDFITDNLGIKIESHRSDQTSLELVTCQKQTEALFNCNDKIKLFFQEHEKYSCYSNNWGRCKGLDHYEDFCVVLNKKTFKKFVGGNLASLPSPTLNKLYVACSRARGDLYFLDQKFLDVG